MNFCSVHLCIKHRRKVYRAATRGTVFDNGISRAFPITANIDVKLGLCMLVISVSGAHTECLCNSDGLNKQLSVSVVSLIQM